ncbi:MAG: hypothetical protein M1818_007248 [Claussenomyces sp. TS43310]|nr:MAG: hypothetical protein M1818_007248 [Claussenomyces sp. TS43310]
MVRFEDQSIPERDAHDEYDSPLPQKRCEDRTIYLSRNKYGRLASVTGIVSIIDFGFSAEGNGPHDGCIQAEPYRAPEVILDAGWTYSSDIWNPGVMALQLWDVLEGKPLLEAVDPLQTEYDDRTHLAYITKLLGPPPERLLARGRKTSKFYDSEETGNLKVTAEIPAAFDLERSLGRIGGKNKRLFLAFVSRMLAWNLGDRSSAKDLLEDPWLKATFSEEP